MTEEEYKMILNVPYEEFFRILENQYIYEYGEKHAYEIMSKAGINPKVVNFQLRLRVTGDIAQPDKLIYFVNSLPFLLFSKSETICIVAVTLAYIRFQEVDSKKYPLGNEPVMKHLLEIVLRCEKTKFIKRETFYTRFFQNLLLY